MRAEEFIELMRRRPFIPLRIHMTDGRIHDVRHLDNILVLRQRVDIGVPADPSSGVLERVEYCSLLHIVRIEELPSTPPPNGASPEAGASG